MAEFINREVIDIPDELFPLVGYVAVPKVVTAEIFDAYWREYQKLQKRLSNKKSTVRQWHQQFQIYNARMCFVLDYHFAIADPTAEEPEREIVIELPDYMKHPRDLPYPAIAAFIFHATQGVYMKTNFYPRLLSPSMTTSRIVDQTAVRAAVEAATEEE